jgi:hypothetical protein
MVNYKRQHWVPQSYLRRFSPDGAHVWMLDKPTGRIACPNILDVARGKFFNDGFLRDERGALPPDVPEEAIEQQYGTWEEALSRATDSALRVAAGGGASLEERTEMAICVAVQLTRTPAFRAYLSMGVIAALEDDANRCLEETRPDLAEKLRVTLTFPPEWSAALQHEVVWSSGYVPKMAVDLSYYIWRIGVNQTELPLCTSDAPVIGFVHEAFQQGERTKLLEDDSDIILRVLVGAQHVHGLEVVFPITPEVVLLMYHPKYFEAMRRVQGKRKLLSIREVLHYNALQYLQAQRQVFSPSDIFATIQNHAARYTERQPDNWEK